MPLDPITHLPPQALLNGDSAALAIDRAVNELKHGRFLAVHDSATTLVVAALETVNPDSIAKLSAITASACLILTEQRAAALGMSQTGPVFAPLSALADEAALRVAAGLDDEPGNPLPALALRNWTGSKTTLNAALRLAKIARVAPALIGAELEKTSHDASVLPFDVANLSTDSVGELPELKRLTECRVPLAGAENTTVMLFRDPCGGAEHIAVKIGDPDTRQALPVRLHSACLTGDVLGSLRCDCGEQLQTAVKRIAELGGGILLYLDQEGRGIGLANKLRAYRFQDAGLDTLDADQYLGFRADERSYGAAAAILQAIGISRIQLLTNNPQKIESLRALGIEVTGRLPLVASANVHNARYLRAKRERAGHLSDDGD